MRLRDVLAEAEARGYARCQADVVAFSIKVLATGMAGAFERGDHVGAAERAKGGENG